jgi:hypothetical protein
VAIDFRDFPGHEKFLESAKKTTKWPRVPYSNLQHILGKIVTKSEEKQ